MTSPRHPVQLRRATLGYLFSQIAGATRKRAHIYGPTLWKIPLLRSKTWRNLTATAYFGPACHTHECDTRKSAAKQTARKVRPRSKQIRGGVAYLPTQPKLTVMPGPILGFGQRLRRLPNVMGCFGCQGRNKKPTLATRAG